MVARFLKLKTIYAGAMLKKFELKKILCLNETELKRIFCVKIFGLPVPIVRFYI